MLPFRIRREGGQPSHTGTDYYVRPAQRRDVEAIVDLWAEMMHLHGGLDDRFRFAADAPRAMDQHVRRCLRSRQARVFVADAGGALVGYVLAELHVRLPIYPVGRYGFVSDLIVHEPYRRRGIGKLLAERAIAWLRSEGVTSAELYAAEANPDAVAFWRAMGFRSYLKMMRKELVVADVGSSGAPRTG